MDDDFFMGFAAHAHTMNELETDPQRELDLKRKNNPEEAQKPRRFSEEKVTARI